VDRRIRQSVGTVEASPSQGGTALAVGPQADATTIRHGALLLDLSALRVSWHGLPVALTVTEFRLLEALVRHAGAVLSREQLLNAAYPDDVYVTERSIDSHIRRIRKKFEATGHEFALITTVYGAGYRFVREATA
ncbi:MAG: winged helix-turn-helix domain-containing protein, partial [Spirochaetales bacterium]